MTNRRSASLALAALFAVAACTPSAAAPTAGQVATPTPPPVETPAPTLAPGATPSPVPAATPVPVVTMTQPWATATLTDVTNGESFSIADLVAAGQIVFIEPMAIWCTNCRRQQSDALTALGSLDRSKVTWLSLDVELSETPEALKEYSRQQGFDFRFSVATKEIAAALAAEFGNLVLSPPSTPIIVVGSDGSVVLTEFGHKSVDEIIDMAKARGA